MNIRYMFSFMRVLKMPGLFPVMKDWRAFIRMNFLYAAYESGLLNALATPCEREVLIEKLQVKRPDLLDALLDVGLATKELAMNNQKFTIKGKLSKAIMGTRGDILAAMIQANLTYYSDAYRYAADRMKGGALGDDLEKIGDLIARFSKGAEPFIRDFIKAAVAGKEPMRVLDVGCGSGIYLQSTYKANQNARGVGLDVDEAVVRQARDNLADWGLNDRFDIFQGDIHHPPDEIKGPFDFITLYNILYYFQEEDRKGLLEKLRGMLSPQGVLAVVMNYQSRGKDVGAANLNMVNCSLKGLTRLPKVDEITTLLRQCGFSKIEIHQFMPGSSFSGIVAVNS